ncbi:hypothetical protein MMC25_004135 [Agyrium rufum]|nr:hypothetical protein [Agyrium rufum]
MSSLPALTPSQWTLFLSPPAYLFIFRLALPTSPSAIRLVQTREALSAVHCTLIASLSAYLLYERRADWLVSPLERPKAQDLDKNLKIVTARSEFANALTALETGYLIQDAGVLLLIARLRAREGKTTLAKKLDWRILGWHHGGLIGALGLLQWYIARGREKAILVVVMLMLMNASTPLGISHWFLSTFRPSKRRSIATTLAAYLTAYAICRVYLLYWILGIFGAHTNNTAIETFRQLRWQCQLGTATIIGTNTSWLVRGLRKFARQHVVGVTGKAKSG